MQFRCYICKLVMHDGIPPMEALSQQQLGYVGGDHAVQDNTRRFDALMGTPYDGMSVYNFCAFCFTVITEFPSYTEASCGIKLIRSKDIFADVQFFGSECDVHGELYRKSIDTTKDESFVKFDEVLRIRYGMFHCVEQLYRNADLTSLAELRDMEV